jgi:replicative DNA helicase
MRACSPCGLSAISAPAGSRDPNDPKYTEWEQLFDKVKGTADVIIAKQRHGPTSTVKLAFQAEFTRFTDLADPNFTAYEEH